MTHRSTDHVLSDLEDTMTELQSEKARDDQRRQAASITDHYGGPAERSDPGEFVGSLELSVPHTAFGGNRPIARRSDGETPPRFSTGVELTTASGSDPDRLQPDTEYEVTVAVRNDGTLSTSRAPLELFVEHRSPSATVDTADGTLELDSSSGQTVTGFSSLPPGAPIMGVGFDRGASTLDSDTIRFAGRWTVGENRTFEVDGDLSTIGSDDYTLRLYDALGMRDLKRLEDSLVPASEISDSRLDGYEDAVLDGHPVVAEVDGVVETYPFNELEPMDLTRRVGVPTFVDHQRVAHRPRDETETTFTVTTPSSRGNRVLTVFYARTYARSPADLPENMNRLDHTQSRFVGRTERNWVR